MRKIANGWLSSGDRCIEILVSEKLVHKIKTIAFVTRFEFGASLESAHGVQVLTFFLVNFAQEIFDLRVVLLPAHRFQNPEGAIRIATWKKAFLRPGLLSWDDVQAAMLPTGWVDNKILSLGDEIYAARYVRRLALR